MEQLLPIFEIIGSKLGKNSKFKNGQFYGKILGRMTDAALVSVAFSFLEDSEGLDVKPIEPNIEHNQLNSIGFGNRN